MRLSASLTFLLLPFIALAQTTKPTTAGYEIRVTLKPLKNKYVYLGHYYGKNLPIIDSARLNEQGTAVFKGPKKLGGGIYLIGFPDRARHFEILVDKSQRFTVVADTGKLDAIQFFNSPENDEFKRYQAFMNANGRAIDKMSKERSNASAQDSIRITTQIENLNTYIKKYREDVVTKSPNSLLAMLIKAMKEPEVPVNDPAAAQDSMFGYKYYKQHYWDGTNFMDGRLTRTPFFESRVDRYFEQLVYPSADSTIKELDWMLSFASVDDDMQRFLLLKFANRYLNQKYMWEDAVFVHLFTKYFSQKEYDWLSEQGKKVITERAYSLMANIMGTPAAEIELPDSTGKNVTLYGTQADYVLLAIWDPTCGHCKEVLPKLDSIYNAKWKNYGLKMFALAKETDGNKALWTEFINKYELNDWVHVYYSKEEERKRVSSSIPSYSQLYDVQSFPTLYLLDKDKRIIAKKLSYEQVDEILQLKMNK